MQNNFQNPLALTGERSLTIGEAIGKHRSVKQVGEDFKHRIDRQVADHTIADEACNQLAPRREISLLMDEIRRPLAIPKLGPLLNKKLNHFRMMFKPSQISGHSRGDPVQRRMFFRRRQIHSARSCR